MLVGTFLQFVVFTFVMIRLRASLAHLSQWLSPRNNCNAAQTTTKLPWGAVNGHVKVIIRSCYIFLCASFMRRRDCSISHLFSINTIFPSAGGNHNCASQLSKLCEDVLCTQEMHNTCGSCSYLQQNNGFRISNNEALSMVPARHPVLL